MNESKKEQLKLFKEESESELASASLDDIFTEEKPGPDAKILKEGEKIEDE